MSALTSQRFVLRLHVDTNGPQAACEFLAARSGLSKRAVKDVMDKGGVWLQRTGSARAAWRRLRRATAELREGDRIELYYDGELLARHAPAARCLAQRADCSIWYKPAGLMAQGTKYGDHCSLLRQVEKLAVRADDVHLVHRLDRETAGLMIVAHTRAAAGYFSRLFREDRITKRYRVQVRGDLAPHAEHGHIEVPLDDKPAHTEFRVLDYDGARDIATADVVLHSGRLHQIRRHFALLGHPVIGDPRYGHGNKNSEGLRLLAYCLEFPCPRSGTQLRFALGEEELSGL